MPSPVVSDRPGFGQPRKNRLKKPPTGAARKKYFIGNCSAGEAEITREA